MPQLSTTLWCNCTRSFVFATLLGLSLLAGCSGGDDSANDAGDGDREVESPADTSSSVVSDFEFWSDYNEDPIGDRTLDIAYPEMPYEPNAEAQRRFMYSFQEGELDDIIGIWSKMGPQQRLEAYRKGTEYRFSIPSEEDDKLEAVQAPFDLLSTVHIGRLEADAAAEASDELGQQAEIGIDSLLPKERGHVRGFVVDRETGEPIEGATIAAAFRQTMLLSLSGEAARWETVTAADGSFEIRDIPVGEAALMAHRLPEYNLHQQRIMIVEDQTLEETVAVPKLARLQLELPTFLTGTVTDSETGEPVIDAIVSIGNSMTTGRTNARGAYMIRKIPEGEHTILARHEDYHDSSDTIVASGPGKVELDFTIDPITTGIVTGTAVNSLTGEVLANVTVTIAGQTVTTDSKGQFRIADIESGDVRVSAGGDGFRPAGSDVTLEARTTAETVLELDPITEGIVRGIVRNAATGDALADTEIRIGPFNTTTNDEGHFEVAEIAQGAANITAQKALFESALQTVDVVAMQTVDVEIDLVPITYGNLVILVSDATNGNPIATSMVTLAGGISGETDAQGRIRFEKVPAGEGLASAERHAYIPGQANYLLAPATEIEQSIELQPVTVGTVQGLVRSSVDGSPIPGASVSIGNTTAQTDTGGRFIIADIAAGPANVVASKPVFEPGSSNVDVVAAELVSVVIQLDPITYGTIDGIVVDALTSKPIADVVVTVTGKNTRTNAAGEFRLERVSAGDVTLSASKRVYKQVDDRFKLAPAETETRRIALPPITYGDVEGQVVDADSGAPLSNVDVSLGTKRVRTDAAGRFGPERVDAGPMNVSAFKASYESGGTNIDVAPAETTLARIELEPIRIGTVVGTVVDAKTNEPVNGARVTLGNQAQETGTDGRFRFEKVGTGSVGVAVRHADYGNGAASGELEGGATLELQVRIDLRREDVTQLEAGLASGGSIDLYGIHFDSGKDQFKASSLGTLNAVLAVMKRAPDRNFTIVGHTDSDGSDANNQNLSARRARTVINWLIDHGIESRRLSATGFGESQPTAPNDTESGKALNRRVELSYTE